VLPAVALPWILRRLPAPFALSRRALLRALVAAALVIAGTLYAFGSIAELALPLRFNGISRAEDSDIQDFSHYWVKVSDVDAKSAARYAETLGLSATASASSLARERAWFKDYRRPESDLSQYQSGLSGCIERVTWVNGTLSYEHHCDWGI
jgi:hypothetical protein